MEGRYGKAGHVSGRLVGQVLVIDDDAGKNGAIGAISATLVEQMSTNADLQSHNSLNWPPPTTSASMTTTVDPESWTIVELDRK